MIAMMAVIIAIIAIVFSVGTHSSCVEGSRLALFSRRTRSSGSAIRLSETPNERCNSMDEQKRDKKTYSRNYDQEEPSPRRLNFRESLGDGHHKGKPHHASYSPKQDSQQPHAFRGFYRLFALSHRGSWAGRAAIVLYVLQKQKPQNISHTQFDCGIRWELLFSTHPMALKSQFSRKPHTARRLANHG